MAAKWLKNFDPQLVLAKIRAANNAAPGAAPSFEAFGLEWPRTALQTMIDISDDISVFAKERAISRAIFAASGSTVALSPETMIAAVNEQLRIHHRVRPTKFVMTTSVSLERPPPSRRAEIRNCDVEYLKAGFPRIFAPRAELEKDWRNDSQPEHTPDDYVKVLVRTEAKLSHDAASACLEALDIHRALTCLLENSRIVISMGGTHRPINRVTLGGLHGLHRADGALAETFYWYQPTFTRVSPHEISDSKVVEKNHRWALRQLTKASPPIRRRLETALLRYVRAFDEPDRNSGFLKAWGALEALLHTNGNENETVIRRACFLFAEPGYARQILEHLRVARNSNVHAGLEVADATTHCFQIQFYFRAAMLFHLRNVEEFDSVDDANLFLDSPVDVQDIDKRMARLRRARRMKSAAPAS
jgi:hypothetical protein